jgi:hypothetical protein
VALRSVFIGSGLDFWCYMNLSAFFPTILTTVHPRLKRQGRCGTEKEALPGKERDRFLFTLCDNKANKHVVWFLRLLCAFLGCSFGQLANTVSAFCCLSTLSLCSMHYLRLCLAGTRIDTSDFSTDDTELERNDFGFSAPSRTNV